MSLDNMLIKLYYKEIFAVSTFSLLKENFRQSISRVLVKFYFEVLGFDRIIGINLFILHHLHHKSHEPSRDLKCII